MTSFHSYQLAAFKAAAVNRDAKATPDSRRAAAIHEREMRERYLQSCPNYAQYLNSRQAAHK